MALEDLNPAVRVEEILDGADIEPATRLEYFMKKAANEVPKPAGSSDAGKVVTVNEDGDGYELGEASGGGALIIKASGEAMYSVDDGYAVQADVDVTTLNNCFLSNTASPVYALFPVFTSFEGVASYSYDNADGNYMMPLSRPQTSVKSSEYETYSVFKLSGHVYLGYKENSV